MEFTHSSTLQHIATLATQVRLWISAHCITLQCARIHCNTLQHIATHCIFWIFTHCNTLQRIATHCNTGARCWISAQHDEQGECISMSVLQCVAVYCSVCLYVAVCGCVLLYVVVRCTAGWTRVFLCVSLSLCVYKSSSSSQTGTPGVSRTQSVAGGHRASAV